MRPPIQSFQRTARSFWLAANSIINVCRYVSSGFVKVGGASERRHRQNGTFVLDRILVRFASYGGHLCVLSSSTTMDFGATFCVVVSTYFLRKNEGVRTSSRMRAETFVCLCISDTYERNFYEVYIPSNFFPNAFPFLTSVDECYFLS